MTRRAVQSLGARAGGAAMSDFAARLREIVAAMDAMVLEYRGTQPDDLLNKLTDAAGRIERMADRIEPRKGPGLLTPTQLKVLAFIRTYMANNGFAPTRGEIAASFCCAVNNIQEHVSALARKGHICLDVGKPRGIRLSKSVFITETTSHVSKRT